VACLDGTVTSVAVQDGSATAALAVTMTSYPSAKVLGQATIDVKFDV
jgi:hypothetical protein